MTDRDHITAELRAVFDGQDIKNDAIHAVAKYVLADPDRWRALLEVAPTAEDTFHIHMRLNNLEERVALVEQRPPPDPARARELLGWTFTGHQMVEAPKVVVASDVGGYSMTNRVRIDDDVWRRAYVPRSLEQRIVGASHAEGDD